MTTKVLDFVAGGFTKGKSEASVLVSDQASQLLVRSANTDGTVIARPLRSTFAEPVALTFDAVPGA